MDILSGSVCTFPQRYAAFPIPGANEFSISFGIFRSDMSVSVPSPIPASVF